jgi:IS30 family transposase
MDKRYKHLNGEERGVILAEHRRGASLGAIGLLLGCRTSTIGRELRRGRPEGDPAQPHCAQLGGDRYRVLRKRFGRRRKLVAGGWLHDFVRSKLIHKRWSPEQIACRLKSMHPDDPTRLISHETIYAAIYAQPKGGLKAEMIAALRQHKPARGLRRTTLAGGSIAPESLRIIHRPEEIEGRLVPGHWEGDLIKGAFNRSAVGTVVERKTRFLILSSSSVRQSIRGIDWCAERAAAPLTPRWRGLPAR